MADKREDVYIYIGDEDDKGALPPMNEFKKMLDKALPLADLQKADKGSGVVCDSCGKPVNFPQDVIEGGGVYYHVNNKNAKVGCGGKIGTGKGKQPDIKKSADIEKREDYNDMGRVDPPSKIGEKPKKIKKVSNVLGTMAGAGIGGAVGGPLGAAVGGAAGHELTKPKKEAMKKAVGGLIEKMEQIEKGRQSHPEYWGDRHLHAAKQDYTCTHCNEPIKAGEKYFRWKWPNSETKRVHEHHRNEPTSQKSIEKMLDDVQKGGSKPFNPERDECTTKLSEDKPKLNPNKEKAALRVRKAMALVNKEVPMTDEYIAKAFGEFDAAPDILKEADGRPSGDWFEHAMGRASQCSDVPVEFVLKIWYGEGTFEKAKKAETERKGVLPAMAGAGIGGAVAGIPGAMAGGGIGAALGKSADEVTKAWGEDEYITKVSQLVGTMAGAGVGGAVGGPLGAAVGGAAGHELTKPKAPPAPSAESSGEAKMEKDLKGALAGGIVGGMAGGPAGAVAGAKIGHSLTKPKATPAATAAAPQQPAAQQPAAQQPAQPVQNMEKSADINKISRGAAAAIGAGLGGVVGGPLGAAGGAYLGHRMGKDKPAAPKAGTEMNVKESSTEGYPTVRSHKAGGNVAKAMIKAKCAKICKDMAGNENEITTNQLGRAFVQSIIEIAGSGDVSKSAEALGEIAEEMLEKGLLGGGESSESSEGIGLMDKAVAEVYDNTKIIPKKNADASQEEDRVSSGTHLKVKDLEPSKKDVSH